MTIIQDLPEAIEFENLNKIKVRGTPETMKRVYKLFNKIGKDVGFQFTDITVSLGVSNPPDFPLDKVKVINLFLQMPDGEEKTKFKTDNKLDDELINAYLEDLKKRDKKLKTLPVKLGDYLLSSETDDDINEIRDIIKVATGYSPEIIKETDSYVLAEILLRVFLKPEDSVKMAFFLNLVLSLLNKFMALLNITKIEK